MRSIQAESAYDVEGAVAAGSGAKAVTFRGRVLKNTCAHRYGV
jgi:hypothetical protein